MNGVNMVSTSRVADGPEYSADDFGYRWSEFVMERTNKKLDVGLKIRCVW